MFRKIGPSPIRERKLQRHPIPKFGKEFQKADLSFPILFEEPPVYWYWSQHCYRHHRPGFIAPLPISRRVHSAVANITEGAQRCCLQRITKFWALNVHCAIGNRFRFGSQRRCQQLFVVDKRPLTDLCVPLAIRLQTANSRTRQRCNVKGISQHGGLVNLSKNIRASRFYHGLSSDRNFGRIHLAGQYL